MPISRAQGHSYYAPTHTVTPGYYYDDAEGYVGDYSESEGLSDAAHLIPADVTEIYRRKAMKECYRDMYEPQYYYEVKPMRKGVPVRASCRRIAYPPIIPEEQPRMPVEHLLRRSSPPQVHAPSQYQPVVGRRQQAAGRMHSAARTRQPVPASQAASDRYTTEYDTTEYESATGGAAKTMHPPSRHRIKLSHSQHPPEIVANVKHSAHYPVTVRTPRYYRRLPTTAVLSKRPSTLCLPLASRPDPATPGCRAKSRRSSTTQQQQQQQEFATTTPTVPILGDVTSLVVAPARVTHVVRRASVTALRSAASQSTAMRRIRAVKDDAQGELGMANSNLDEILTQYEKYFDNEGRTDDRNEECYRTDVESIKNKIKTPIHPVRKARLIKPQKREKASQRTSNKSIESSRKCPGAYEQSPPPPFHSNRQSSYQLQKKSAENTPRQMNEEDNATAEMLDSLLADLMKNGCTNKLQEQQQQQGGRCSPKNSGDPAASGPPLMNPDVAASPHRNNAAAAYHINSNNKQSLNVVKSTAKNVDSVNYQELTAQKLCCDNLYNDNNKSRSPPHTPSRSSNNQIQQQSRKICASSSGLTSATSKIPLDEKSAMELHKSKSYIVNLIDRALSRELGTLPEQKYNGLKRDSGGYPELSPQAAVDMVKTVTSNASRLDKELSAEITQALTESLISNVTAPKHERTESDRCSNVAYSGDEPPYVKQLKQLRWGHLRHIQQEVRRLQDLERFLDSCSSGSSFINNGQG